MIVEIFKAQPTLSSQGQLDDLVITATEQIPDLSRVETLKQVAELYKIQGEKVADALFAHLPGGTVDAILARMLERRASLFAVRF